MDKYTLYELTEKGISTAVINNIILSGVNLSSMEAMGLDAFQKDTGVKKPEVYEKLCALEKEAPLPYSIYALTSAGVSDKTCATLKRQGLSRIFMLKLYPESFFKQKLSLTDSTIRKIKEALAIIPEAVDKSVPMVRDYLEELYQNQEYMRSLKRSILRALNEDYIMEDELSIKLDECYKNGQLLDKALEELALQEFIECSLFGIKKLQANLKEFLFSMPEDKNSGLLKDYLLGVSLERMSIDYGISKEKIKPTLMKYPFPQLSEDEYLEIYYSYFMTAEDFTRIFALDSSVFRYLELRAARPMGNRNVLEMLEDERVSQDVRVRIQNTLGKYAKIHGISVVKTPQDILEIYAKFEVKTALAAKPLFEEYKKYWFSLFHEELPVTEKQWESILDSSKVLLEGKEGYRYYNLQVIDSAFYQSICLKQYQDVEISARIIFDAAEATMNAYDIHDEMELYHILKKTYRKNDIEFIRKPILVFGSGNRNNQIKTVLFELSPVSMSEFTKAYSRIYGVNEKSFSSYAAKQFSPYYQNGSFTVNTPKMKEEILSMYRDLLHGDFYFIAEVAQLAYKEGIPFQEYYFNREMIASLGYRDGIRCIYKNTYSSLEEYVQTLFTEEIHLDTMSPRLVALPEFQKMLQEKVMDYEYIEVEPKHYVRRELLNLPKDLALDFVDAVKNGVYEDEVFTIASLKNKGFSHELLTLGYSDYILSSLFQPLHEVIYQRCYSNTGVLLKVRIQRETIGICTLIEQIIESKYYMYLPDIVRDLEALYGITLSEAMVKMYIQGTDIYCNPDTMLYYLNYESYKRMR